MYVYMYMLQKFRVVYFLGFYSLCFINCFQSFFSISVVRILDFFGQIFKMFSVCDLCIEPQRSTTYTVTKSSRSPKINANFCWTYEGFGLFCCSTSYLHVHGVILVWSFSSVSVIVGKTAAFPLFLFILFIYFFPAHFILAHTEICSFVIFFFNKQNLLNHSLSSTESV